MRIDRVISSIARETSRIVAQDLKDPRLGMVTITRVDLNRDLSKAIIYYTTLGDAQNDQAVLDRARGFIRTELAHRVRIKFIPDLEFRHDESPEYGKRIDALIDETKAADHAE